MKKIMLLFAAILMIGFAVNAQTVKTVAPATNVAKKQVQNPAAYACPKCFKISKGAGQCSDDKIEKVQLGTYYCAHCIKSTDAKAGKCASCGMATTQMTRKYCAKMGGTPEKVHAAAASAKQN